MDRVEESQGQSPAEIPKRLHPITRVATNALEHAREAKNRSAAAVEEKLNRLMKAENEIHCLGRNCAEPRAFSGWSSKKKNKPSCD
jgi:hypothetical protein